MAKHLGYLGKQINFPLPKGVWLGARLIAFAAAQGMGRALAPWALVTSPSPRASRTRRPRARVHAHGAPRVDARFLGPRDP